jgi:hypothetical protein
MLIKTGAWRRDLAGLQQRRLHAAPMFACGATQAEVARTFECHARPPACGIGSGTMAASRPYAAPGGQAAPRGCRRRSWTPSTRPCGLARKRSGSTPSCGPLTASRQ